MRKKEIMAKDLETGLVIMRDGLMSPSGVFTPSLYICSCFCRIPKDWTNGGRVKESAMEKFFEIIYGEKWKAGNTNGSRYIVPHPNSKVFTPEELNTIKWGGTADHAENQNLFYIASENGELKRVFEINDNRYFFFITCENGELKKVSESEFGADIRSSSRTHAASQMQNNSLPAQAVTVKVQYKRLQDVLLIFLIFLFGSMILLLLGGSIRMTNLVIASLCLSVLFVICYLAFRAKRKAVKMFDALGITRGDNQRFSWNEFQGVIRRTAINPRNGQKYLWRIELKFGGEESWIIPQRIKNFGEVLSFVDTLPAADLNNAK